MIVTLRQTATTCALVLTALLTATLACADGGGTQPVEPGTGGGGGGTTPPPPAAVASVSVTPASASVVVGGTQSLVAGARDAAGNALTGRAVTWSSGTPAVATVSAAGVVTAVAAGSATITATVEGITGTATITVTPVPVASVSVTPVSVSISPGFTQQMAATPRDAGGAALSGRPASWSSSAPAVASIDNAGLVTAVAAGSTTIRATVEGIVGTATITVVATGGGGGGSIFDLRDSVVVATQGFFLGAASSTFSRIAVAPHVDATATTRDLVFLDANGTIEARRNLGGSSWAVAMTPDGTRTVAGSDDENLYFFSGTALVSSGRPIPGNIEIRGVAISDDGRWVGAGGGRFTLHDWNAANRVAPVYVDSSTTQLRAIDFAANGRYVAYGGRITTSPADPGTTYIAVYDLQAQQRVFRELIPCPGCSNGELRQLAISADGDRILAGDWGGRLHYFIRDGSTWTRTTQSVGSRVYWVDMSADGTRAAVGVQESGVRLFSLGATATQLWERTGTDGGQRTVHITPDARYITASTRGGGGGGGQIVVHDAAGALVLSRASYAVNTGSGYKARGGAAEPEAWFARVSDDGTRALLASYQGVLYFFVRR
jgi:WD40 repeat protein